MTGKCQGYIFSDRQNIRIRIRIYTSKLSSQVHRRRPRCGALHFAQHRVQGRRRGSVLSRLLRHEVRAHWMHPLWAGEVTQSNMFPLLFHTWPKTRHFVFAIHFLCNQKSIKIPLRSCGLFLKRNPLQWPNLIQGFFGYSEKKTSPKNSKLKEILMKTESKIQKKLNLSFFNIKVAFSFQKYAEG